jgi:hypothetical protein
LAGELSAAKTPYIHYRTWAAASLPGKQKNGFPRIKILFTSGYDNEAIVDHGALQKGNNFIQKPLPLTHCP